MLELGSLKVGKRCNWIGQTERLVYMGTKLYPGDRRTWHQFAKVDTPHKCWSEVLAGDLRMLEETASPEKP